MLASEEARDRHYRLWLRVLFFSALVLRLGFVLLLHSPRDFIYSDMQSYDSVAFDLLLGRPNPWHAFRPVGYSMLLAGVYALTDGSRTFVGVLQALMAAALVPWSAQLARAAGATRAVASVVAVSVTTSLPLIFYCGLILTEIPTAFFLVLGLKILLVPAGSQASWRDWAKAGFALGLAGALRPNLLLVLPVVGLYLVAREVGRTRFIAIAVFASTLLVPIGFVSAYNTRVLGRVAGPSANGGLNFYLNFADVHTVQYQGVYGAYWISPVPNGFRATRQELTDTPLFDDAHYYGAGVRYLREHPRALLRAFENFREVAGLGRQLLWPNWQGREPLFRLYALLFFACVLLPAGLFFPVLGLRVLRHEANAEALLLAGLCLVTLLPTYLFLGDPRVRVPFDPLWLALAGLWFQSLFTGLARWRRRRSLP